MLPVLEFSCAIVLELLAAVHRLLECWGTEACTASRISMARGRLERLAFVVAGL